MRRFEFGRPPTATPIRSRPAGGPRLCWPPILACVLGLAGCGNPEQARLAQDAVHLRAELQATRWQLQTLRIERDDLAQRVHRAEASALQLRSDTKLLGDANTELADAVNRLSYEDWNKVVPDVQLRFSDVENAAHDLDSRVVRVLNALGGESPR